MTSGASLSGKILVTGGAGYIGSQTCKTLKKMGYEPVVYDNLSRGHSWAIKWGPLVKGDLSETARLVRTMQEHKVEAVVHFAAFAYVGESVEKPELYYENNFGGTLSLLKAMQTAGVKNLVFSSTCATYGVPQSATISEDHPQNPINPYGRSKLMVEKMLEDSSLAWGLKATALRYFNAAGADLDGELGEAHDPETHLIPLAIDAALGKIPALTIFGDDYETKDGTCVRDYIHVQDLASAHVMALQKLSDSHAGFEAYNLGTGSGYTVQEVIDKVNSVSGKRVPVNIGARRPGDPPILVADATKSKKLLNWEAKHSDLETIITSALKWHQR
jgi:UDP-arabinose 4-epimerase